MDASAAAPVDREVVEQVADEIVRRLHNGSARQVDLEAVAQQIDTIYDRIDTLAAHERRADDAQPVVQQLLEKLREADRRAALSPRRVRPPSTPRSARIWLSSDLNRRALTSARNRVSPIFKAFWRCSVRALRASRASLRLMTSTRSCGRQPDRRVPARPQAPRRQAPTTRSRAATHGPSQAGERGRSAVSACRRRRRLPHRARRGRAAARARSS